MATPTSGLCLSAHSRTREQTELANELIEAFRATENALEALAADSPPTHRSEHLQRLERIAAMCENARRIPLRRHSVRALLQVGG
jgi:hypothetical protein